METFTFQTLGRRHMQMSSSNLLQGVQIGQGFSSFKCNPAVLIFGYNGRLLKLYLSSSLHHPSHQFEKVLDAGIGDASKG